MKRLTTWTLLAAVVPMAQAQQASMHDMHDMSMREMDMAHPSPVAPTNAAPVELPVNDHVPPPPPRQVMPDGMSMGHDDAMDMHDTGTRGMLLVDRLEYARGTTGTNAWAWEGQAWWGTDIDRLWLYSEGEHEGGMTRDARIDAMWSHAWTTYWDGQLGIRHDLGQGPQRSWLAVGVQGLAPYWFDTQATFYLGEGGRTSLRVESSYDVLLTQRLILSPKVEVNLYGRNDAPRGIRSGLSEAEVGLRLRYEFSRRFAPYVGVSWAYHRVPGEPVIGAMDVASHETTWLAGVRLWF
ncbi:copper resistance protein B [Dyella sp.]|uniref:copper resistance protein B n=1 Tax=Dyella sp. TaxID=1869338 RepID=UPI002ED3D340